MTSHGARRASLFEGWQRLGLVATSLCLVFAVSNAVAPPAQVVAADLTPTTTEVSVSPNPTPRGEWTVVTAHVTPLPTTYSYAVVEFVYALPGGGSWVDIGPVNNEGLATSRQLLGIGTYEVTAVFLGAADRAPSTSETEAFAVLERIISTPGMRLDVPVVYAYQEGVPFTIWARPVPLTGDLFVNGGDYLKVGPFPPAVGESHGQVTLGNGTYQLAAQLTHGSDALGCPVTVSTVLRPADPRLSAQTETFALGELVWLDLSVFDPSTLPRFVEHQTAKLYARHEDGSETSKSVDISAGRASAWMFWPKPGRYDVWFTLEEYIWARAISNHLTINVLPGAMGEFARLPEAEPGAIPTSISLAELPDTAWKDDTLSFVVTVDPPPDEGQVLIEDGSASFGMAIPTGVPGRYRADVYRLPAGPHRFRARYEGSGGYAPSASEPQDVIGESIATTTTLTFSPNHPDALTNVTMTATVSPVPSGGTIYVYRDGTLELWGQVDRTTGTASWTRTWPTWAVHHLTATFEYGGRYSDSHSEQVALEVSIVPTGVTLTGPTEVAHADDAVALTAAFERDPIDSLAYAYLYVDGELVATRLVEHRNPLVMSYGFRPGEHNVRVNYSPEPGVVGWSNELIVNVGPYANRSPIHGTVVVNSGNPFTNSELVLVEPALDPDSADAHYFQLSNDAVHWASFSYFAGLSNSLLWDLSDVACGGSAGSGAHRLYYRWTDWHGSDQSPVESVAVTITDSQSTALALDQVAPIVIAPVASPTPQSNTDDLPTATTVDWNGSDDLSGIAHYELELSVDGSVWQPVALADPIQHSARLELIAGSAYRFRVRARDGAGNLSAWSASDLYVPPQPGDFSPPEVFAPDAEIVAGRAIAAKPLVRIAWPAATDSSGIASYRLETRLNGRAWKPVTLDDSLARSVTFGVAIGARYELRLRASDAAGNTSAYVTGAPFHVVRVQETAKAVKYFGRWSRVAVAGASGGYVKKSSVSGARATYTFTGRWIAVASTLGPNRGIVRIVLDGTATAVDLYSPTTISGWLVFAAGVSEGSHTVSIEPTGQRNGLSRGKRVDVDALIVLQ